MSLYSELTDGLSEHETVTYDIPVHRATQAVEHDLVYDLDAKTWSKAMSTEERATFPLAAYETPAQHPENGKDRNQTRIQSKKSKRFYLDVPYEDRAIAKSQGAKWDGKNKCWFILSAKDGTFSTRGLEAYVPFRVPDPVTQFAEVLKDAGFILTTAPKLDGKSHRAPVDESDLKKRTESGVYIGRLLGDGARASYTNFKTGEEGITWQAKLSSKAFDLNNQLDPTMNINQDTSKTVSQAPDLGRASNAAFKTEPATQDDEIDPEKVASRARYMFRMTEAWANPDNTPYLAAKGMKGFAVKSLDDGTMIVPARNVEGQIQTLQFIKPDGSKRFMKGGAKLGSFFKIDPDKKIEGANRLYIVEGYATGGTIFLATKEPTIVAFDSGNINEVGKALREAYPDKELVYVADNDHSVMRRSVPYNTGLIAAQEAAQETRGSVVYPKFNELQRSHGMTDFDDLRRTSGLVSVKHALQAQLAQTKEQGPSKTAPTLTQKKTSKSVGMDLAL